MIEVSGSIFETNALAIAHGVNTRGLMGAGIAKQFRTFFPEMFDQYSNSCFNGSLVPGGVFAFMYENLVIYNIASQDDTGPCARLEWIESGLYTAAEHAWSLGVELIAIPHIGCGIGGLNLTEVVPVILDVEAHTGVEFELWTYSN